MELLLIFFALPLAVVIASIALQKILKSPVLVAAIIFSIGVIVTFVIGNLIILVITIIYTIISYLTAYLTCIVCKFYKNNKPRYGCGNRENNRDRIPEDVLTINANEFNQENGNWNCTCSQNSNVINGVIRLRTQDCSCQNDNIVDTRINVIPNSNNNGRSGCICGKYRRR